MYDKMFREAFTFWDKLSEEESESLLGGSLETEYRRGEVIYCSETECKGIFLVLSGSMRVYIVSEEGREVTLFRVYGGESCVLTASCLLEAIQFEVIIQAVEEVRSVLIPVAVLHPVMNVNPYVELYMYKKAAERFSDVVWTMQQILFMGADRRVAIFLWDEMLRQKRHSLRITHDEIAKNIGSAREVVTKVLKYCAQEGVLALGRGQVEIVDKLRLQEYL